MSNKFRSFGSRRFDPHNNASARERALDAERRFRAHVVQERAQSDVQRIGLSDSLWTDLYHHTITVSWPLFMVWSAALYITVNVVFAGLYDLCDVHIAGARAGHFADLIFFSVQTFSTVGYGTMAPASAGANVLASIEVLGGMMINALTTGAVFARFARPRARLIFSQQAVISAEHGMPALCVRVANCRRSAVLSLDVELTLSRLVMGENGHPVRRFESMSLLQSHIPLLRFAFVLAHVIDEKSPLYELNHDELEREEAEILVTVTGTDEATGQNVLARGSYRFEHVLNGHRFVDIIDVDANGRLAVNYGRFHDIEQDQLWKTPEERVA
ncbi:ion channel [Neoasaia chiangmaiensis]|uniref:ion channel n=1 Tax=Neoasaia chiangmaiensis TaxID=320497 RepID=UPI001FE94506|nr:ion channel [Neoasaia chiangmaiensis]